MPRKIVQLPVLPLKQSVLYHGISMPITVGRPASLAALRQAMSRHDKSLVILAQRDASVEDPAEADLYRVGTRARLKQMAEDGQGRAEALLLGEERLELKSLGQEGGYAEGSFAPLPFKKEEGAEIEALRRELLEAATRMMNLAGTLGIGEALQLLSQAGEAERLTYVLGTMLLSDTAKSQELLEAPGLGAAMRLLLAHLGKESEVLRLRKNIARHAQEEIGKEQRDYILRQQLKAIQEELGEKGPEQAAAQQLRKRLEAAGLPPEAKKEGLRELERLEQMPAAAAESSVLRSWLEFMLELPWNALAAESLDLARARRVLEEDHAGLEDVKARILEHLAVLKLNPAAKAPILCFVGAPGVGKTSLGQSIARALGRPFERSSLGGMHDEAELRGHRRTYVGAMPGRVLQALRRAGVRNPLLMLDEVDKLGRDFRGDPAAAMLELLDPQQNASFRDNYLDLAFDLSRVFFITTANSLDGIPAPLLDRMEVLRLPGYSQQEKLDIATRFLLPRQLAQAGLTQESFSLGQDALKEIIASYTREAGVRQLERAIARVLRKAALKVAEDPAGAPKGAGAEDLAAWLGPPPFYEEVLRRELKPGVAAGLAWTEAGGDVLYIESALLPGGRGLTLTGQLGEVMQESARAALSWVWAHATELGVREGLLRRSGVHLHVPAGAVPKDGPSAGVAMAAALASLASGAPLRSDTAMTGEVTLSGLVLPVGGIKEKLLAAQRGGIRRVLLPRENAKDLAEIPAAVRDSLEIVLLSRVEEALEAALEPSQKLEAA